MTSMILLIALATLCFVSVSGRLCGGWGHPCHSEASHGLDDSDFERAKTLHERLFARPDNETKPEHINCRAGQQERAAIKDMNHRWPNKRVPYTIDGRFNQNDRAVIAKAIQRYHETTCVKFEPKKPQDKNFVNITPGKGGCSSIVGMWGGQQDVSLGNGCVYVNTVEHELMHALGFEHEHERPDRDDWIRVHFENVQEGAKSQFKKESWNEVQDLGEGYDYASIMHYGPTAFSKNNKPTMDQLKKGPKIGESKDFSPSDTRKINKLYQCPKK